MDSHTKKQFLDAFLAKHADLPEQGSDAWLVQRKYTIGGSEMSSIDGTNSRKSVKNLVADKAGIGVPFTGNIYTQWGKVFEPVVQLYLEHLFDAKIYETGSLPGCIGGTSYSPDGFTVASASRIRSLVDDGTILDHDIDWADLESYDEDMRPQTIDKECATVLFEIKSPHSRLVTGQIPKYYVSQPVSGREHFPWIDISYFVDVCFKKCSIAQLSDRHSYDRQYHKREVEGPSIAHGIIGVYWNRAPDSDNMSEFDYGKTGSDFDTITYGISTGTMGAQYYVPENPDTFSVKTTLRQFIQHCKDHNLQFIGVIPFKIMKCAIVPVPRQRGFVHGFKHKIDRVIETVKTIRESPDPQAEFDRIFNEEDSTDDSNPPDIPDFDEFQAFS